AAEIEAGGTLAPLVETPQQGAAELLYALGLAVNTDGGNDLSTVYLNLALHLDPGADLVRLALGDMLQSAGNHKRAIELFSAVPKDSMLEQTAAIEMALSLDALDRPDEAAEAIKEVLAGRPNDLEASLALGDIYRSRKRFAEAA